ncbi:dnaJ homolog subfamily C member 3-like [Perca flavescens]|uniref:dnaJ homolog subfamily C member 3-like n=1 Tax=Perca flavescens TaxID=8167 RepID=UPI00106DE201|nr:dnaJ homolog subfamily C member 3-like [Perca flavescens]
MRQLLPSSTLSLSEVRQCLKLDPDHKHCYSHYEQAKKLNSQIQSAEELIREQRYTDAVRKYEAVMKTEPNVRHFSLLAKERMSMRWYRASWPAELSQCVAKSSRQTRRTLTC